MADENKNEKKSPPSELEKAIAKALEEGIAKGIAMASQLAHVPAGKAAAPSDGLDPHEVCSTCRQRVKTCKNKHRKVAVYPDARKYGRWFQGIIINGVRYLSNSKQHAISVPADCDIEFLIQNWERNEDELSTGRVVEHDSGGIGTGSAFSPAHQGWR